MTFSLTTLKFYLCFICFSVAKINSQLSVYFFHSEVNEAKYNKLPNPQLNHDF